MSAPTVTEADRERARRFLDSFRIIERDGQRNRPETEFDLSSEFAAVAAEARRAALEEACRVVEALGFRLPCYDPDADPNTASMAAGRMVRQQAASAIHALMEKENER